MVSKFHLMVAVACVAVAAASAWVLSRHLEMRWKDPVATQRPTGLLPFDPLPNGVTWELDADSVKGPRSSRQGWVISDHSNDKSVSYRESKKLYHVDCETTATRIISHVEYVGDGKYQNEGSYDPANLEPSFFPPGSQGYAVVKRLCAEDFGP